MPQTAINLYSVRELDESVVNVVDRVADAGYDGVQFSGRLAPTARAQAALASKLDETGLDVTPAHIGLDVLETNLDGLVDVYGAVGVDAAVIPGGSPADFESAAAVDELARRVNDLADDLTAAGWDLHYHNHAFEFVDLGEELAFDRFVDATEVGVELDVGWALVGGDDPADRIRRLGDRVELVHVKDMDTSVEHGFVEGGEGDVDVHACIKAAEAVGSDWLIYEHDDPDDPLVTIEHGGEFLAGAVH